MRLLDLVTIRLRIRTVHTTNTHSANKMSAASTILRRIVSTAKAAKVNSPYKCVNYSNNTALPPAYDNIYNSTSVHSQAIVADRTVYVSGCLGMDKTTGQLVSGGVAAETQCALANLSAILVASGSSVDRVVKTTIFVQNLDEFGTVNEEYKKGVYQRRAFRR